MTVKNDQQLRDEFLAKQTRRLNLETREIVALRKLLRDEARKHENGYRALSIDLQVVNRALRNEIKCRSYEKQNREA